jgi:hypothetical protein
VEVRPAGASGARERGRRTAALCSTHAAG